MPMLTVLALSKALTIMREHLLGFAAESGVRPVLLTAFAKDDSRLDLVYTALQAANTFEILSFRNGVPALITLCCCCKGLEPFPYLDTAILQRA